MTDVDPERFTHLSFDCYGTLIDWESGILDAVLPLLTKRGATVDAAWVVRRYAEHEAELEAGAYAPYADVLRDVMRRLAEDAGVTLEGDDIDALARSAGAWPPFADTVAALERLSSRYALVIASNVDAAIFEKTHVQLKVPFAEIVTAEQLGSYKPRPAHFTAVLERTGAPVERVLHVAQSLYHDHVPAQALGFTTAWINRPSVTPNVGVARAAEAAPDMEVPDLASLATRLET